jgi:hypothetical protein
LMVSALMFSTLKELFTCIKLVIMRLVRLPYIYVYYLLEEIKDSNLSGVGWRDTTRIGC